MEALNDTAIPPSVCLSQSRLQARWLPAAGRPPENVRTADRPRTDFDPRRVKLLSAEGGISSRRRRARITIYINVTDLTQNSRPFASSITLFNVDGQCNTVKIKLQEAQTDSNGTQKVNVILHRQTMNVIIML